MNISQKYTPGPWIATHIIGSWWIEDDDPTAFCRRRVAIVDDGAGIDSPEANARLIAAAPELLTALESAREFIVDGMAMGFVGMPEDENVLEVIENAISKAKGIDQ